MLEMLGHAQPRMEMPPLGLIVRESVRRI